MGVFLVPFKKIGKGRGEGRDRGASFFTSASAFLIRITYGKLFEGIIYQG